MLADELDYVIGVDTHRDRHALAVVAAGTGAVVAQTVVAARARGYAAALRFADRHAGGARVWAVEGAGHYGAGLSRSLAEQGETASLGSHGRGGARGHDAPPSRPRLHAQPGTEAPAVLPIGGADDDLSGLLGREDVGVDHEVVIGGRLVID